MTGLKNNIFNNNIAGNTSNILVPDTAAIQNGIEFKSNINSNVLNGYYNLLSEAVQYLQFTGGLYSEQADYNEGNIASLVIKNGEDYSIWQFRRNANNPQVLNNNPPITGASITTVNGVDAYEGGTLNTDWDKLTEDYAVEAAPNTVMGRDSEGASNVNMPSSIENTSVVNNQYLQQELQAGLAAKQDKLTAGTNVEITEDNVINVKGDVATDAESVSYDNSKTNLEYSSGYDFPKFKIEIPETINLVLADAYNTTVEYQAAIIKQADGSYRLNLSAQTYQSTVIQFIVKSIEGQYGPLNIYTILSQFFEIEIFKGLEEINYFDLDTDECIISGIDTPLKAGFLLNVSSSHIAEDSLIALVISRQDDIAIPQSNYTVNLNIKNRVLRNQDINIFGFNYNFSSLYNLTLINNNANVKLTGSFTALGSGVDGLYFYNTIIENYFNVIDDLSNLKVTDGITSSSGKAVKFGITKVLGDKVTIYMFLLGHQDDTDVEAGEIFTFNLTPDKNSTLNPIYSEAANVQQAIEVVVNEKIPDVYDYSGKETLTNKIVKFADGRTKPVYRKFYQVPITLKNDLLNQEQITVIVNELNKMFVDMKKAQLNQNNSYFINFPYVFPSVYNYMTFNITGECFIRLIFFLTGIQIIDNIKNISFFLDYYYA
ncbi:hypothetical protein R4K54_08995 [Brachyspira murdochii]|uniref:hypothetical protein n=1 Tax=Brachyspira murdochii TaxID=84378 RepID=UPI003003CB8B